MALNDDQLKEFFKASPKEPKLLRIPSIKYLMIDGTGDPNNSPEFQAAVQALYSLAYGIKFGRKKRGEPSDYKITPLEGQWWADDMNAFMPNGDRSAWKWTLMIAQPSFITQRDLNLAVEQALDKGVEAPIESVRLAPLKEGAAVQIMHVGPYATEGTTIEKLHHFATDHGYELTGKHHEIYMGDPRRTKPANLKTILRQPVLLRKKAAQKA